VSLSLKNISLALGAFTLEVDVEIQRRITVLFGPSGSGKTSLLDVVAGLRRPESALIRLDDDVLTDTAAGIHVPARRRGIGYVPQDLALFPHLSVGGNLRYGHRPARLARGGPGGETRFTFEQVVALLELGPLLERGVVALSGGEKQRVALARALLASPRLLLLDEPLASLDLQLKAKILPYLARIRDEFRIPMLYVTHDRFETLSLADDLVVLVNGRVAQTGAVQEVFSQPANLAVAGILTVETILPGRIVKTFDDLVTVAVGPTLLAAVPSGLPAETTDVHVCIRAEDVILLTGAGAGASSSPRNHLPATVQSITRDGVLRRIELDCGFRLAALLTRQACDELALQPGSNVVALIKAPNVHLIRR
jgi:molybdate transport system ATP-binding protein